MQETNELQIAGGSPAITLGGAAVPTLQEKLEVIEGLVDDCHEVVSKMRARPETVQDASPASPNGASVSADRCRESLTDLLSRLNGVASEVGVL